MSKRELTEAELRQRREAAERSTGPRTEEGKARSSRNSWVHGRYSAINQRHFSAGVGLQAQHFGKPCRSTCPKHPDNPERSVAACPLVVDGLTRDVVDMLDVERKQVFVDAFDSLMEAMERHDLDGVHGLMASQAAQAIEQLQEMREAVRQHGYLQKIPATTREGDVIYDQNGNTVAAKWVPNPLLAHLNKLMEVLGVNLGEMMATRKARQKAQDAEDSQTAMQKMLGQMFSVARSQAPPGRTLEHSRDDVGDADVDDDADEEPS